MEKIPFEKSVYWVKVNQFDDYKLGFVTADSATVYFKFFDGTRKHYKAVYEWLNEPVTFTKIK